MAKKTTKSYKSSIHELEKETQYYSLGEQSLIAEAMSRFVRAARRLLAPQAHHSTSTPRKDDPRGR